MHVAVCECGIGNVKSVVRAIERARPDVRLEITRDPDAVRRADVVVVPGQGSFGTFAEAMRDGLGDALVEHVRRGRPYLGICLGLQVLFAASDEAPDARGLAVLQGRVARLEPGVEDGRPRPLPHIGWNRVEAVENLAASAIPTGEHFYFAHSYVVVPEDRSLIAATTTYGDAFASAISWGAALGVQFHPEKSQRAGQLLLERFFRG